MHYKGENIDQALVKYIANFYNSIIFFIALDKQSMQYTH